MSRLLILLVAAIGAACSQPSERTIPYRSDAPIADRLLPGDKKVVVEMKMSEAPPEGSRQESFEQEIQRLEKSEITAVIRVTTVESEIADLGTWVRTKVKADVDRMVQAPPRRQFGPSIEFTFGGGTTRIGDVEVTTGKYPQFLPGERYLVFLMTRRGTADWLTWSGIAFRIDAQGVLQRVGINGGGEQSLRTNLVGRSASEVVGALAR